MCLTTISHHQFLNLVSPPYRSDNKGRNTNVIGWEDDEELYMYVSGCHNMYATGCHDDDDDDDDDANGTLWMVRLASLY